MTICKFTDLKNTQDTNWICYTCDSFIHNGRLPPYSMEFPDKPSCFNLTSLEEHLTSPRIPFMQIHEFPKGWTVVHTWRCCECVSQCELYCHYFAQPLDESQTIPVSIRPLKVFVQTSDIFKKEHIEVQDDWVENTVASNTNETDEWQE